MQRHIYTHTHTQVTAPPVRNNRFYELKIVQIRN